ncbi:hypothetical protein PsYK624_107090 [Phanerochaete sordida]|uniref:Uncharacterized protein n=1 Tax=Phanerochaete sordida TaxID=48140 RepID=A0A9P3LHC6_9APHY|nr:hypothetical protein PsYK624_107090 [Phanerochaete sordida]
MSLGRAKMKVTRRLADQAPQVQATLCIDRLLSGPVAVRCAGQARALGGLAAASWLPANMHAGDLLARQKPTLHHSVVPRTSCAPVIWFQMRPR